ncbi:hypothetical protein [Methylobacter sp.]|uniref:hypothetical protein n=1 Tax=Methylobacter sp. TaxID=2051955 RepID=UPI003DA1F612
MREFKSSPECGKAFFMPEMMKARGTARLLWRGLLISGFDFAFIGQKAIDQIKLILSIK